MSPKLRAQWIQMGIVLMGFSILLFGEVVKERFFPKQPTSQQLLRDAKRRWGTGEAEFKHQPAVSPEFHPAAQ